MPQSSLSKETVQLGAITSADMLSPKKRQLLLQFMESVQEERQKLGDLGDEGVFTPWEIVRETQPEGYRIATDILFQSLKIATSGQG